MIKSCLNMLSSFVISFGLITSSAFAAAEEADPDWPCVQRLLPEIAGGMIWSGPPLDEAAEAKEGEKNLKALADELSARRVPIEDAEEHVESFAAELDDTEKASSLTNLFKLTLDVINKDRASIINGIKKFSRGQRNLADKITAKNQKIESIDKSEILKRDALRAERDWDIRIFEDRRQSLVYLCEQPVLLEQRAFALARAIASHLE
ncbi:MAG: hypothetical protein ACR2QH_05190 [Geminicoccaceae bacterium]